jgi:hypothetical protein
MVKNTKIIGWQKKCTMNHKATGGMGGGTIPIKNKGSKKNG